MALFKILKGDSSRISTDVTPFHNGWAYFTPDNGGFYIDTEDDGVQRRVRVTSEGGGSSSVETAIINATLLASSWVDMEQSVNISGIANTSNGIVGITQDVTSDQYEAANAAMMQIVGQTESTIKIRANGVVPTRDIPIIIMILVGSDALYATLLAANWHDGEQTITINGLTEESNGVIGIASNATDEQTEAANLAKLKIESQVGDKLTISVLGKVPVCDIHIAVILTD